MRKTVDLCVDCGDPCVPYCRLREKQTVRVCDFCGEPADLQAELDVNSFERVDLCEPCFTAWLRENAEMLTTGELAEALGVKYERFI